MACVAHYDAERSQYPAYKQPSEATLLVTPFIAMLGAVAYYPSIWLPHHLLFSTVNGPTAWFKNSHF
jgi:hypothetical protein